MRIVSNSLSTHGVSAGKFLLLGLVLDESVTF